MKTLVIAGLVVSILVVFNELRFVGRTGLAWVLIGLAGVQAIHGWILWGVANRRG